MRSGVERMIYKCGHETNGVLILDDMYEMYDMYDDWANSVGIFGNKSLCFKCYCKLKELKE